jgi:hypothetical protein
VTSGAGTFSTLVPQPPGSQIMVYVNRQTPDHYNQVTVFSHFWDPLHGGADSPVTPAGVRLITLEDSKMYYDWRTSGTPIPPYPLNNIFVLPDNVATWGTASISTSGAISAVVKAAGGLQPLDGIPVELRDATGGVIVGSTTLTTAGSVNFNQLADSTYYLTPVLDRKWTAMPPQQKVTITGGVANPAGAITFLISGIPATLKVTTANPGDFVLVSTFSWSASAPPQQDFSRGGAASSILYSAIAERDPSNPSGSVASINVAAGLTYQVKCWQPNAAFPFGNPTASVTVTGPGSAGLSPSTAACTVACGSSSHVHCP